MNYHILNGGMVHLSPSIIKNILYYSKLTNENGENEHFFYIANYGSIIGANKNLKEIYDPIFIENSGNYKYINSSLQMMYLLLSIKLSTAKLFLHGTIKLFRFPIIYMLVLLLRSSKVLKKINLLAWGQGCFSYDSKKIIIPVARRFYSTFISKIGHLLTISAGDYKLAKNITDNAKRVNYLGEIVLSPVKKDKNKLIIVVSHSGWLHNNHIESFKQIEHLKDENITIVCPLCYGDADYIKKVISEGQRIFKEKFTFFTELKSLEEYTELLESAHVYISNAKVQTGLFAVHASMLGGAHVFLTDNLLFSLKKESFVVRYVSEIKTLSYSSLMIVDKDVCQHNNNKMKKNFNENIKIWKDLYN